MDTALRLFLEQGYGATSLDQVADEAGVSTPTVYAKFGSKAGLLKVVVDVAIAGDDEDVAVVDRPEFRAMLSDAPLAERLRSAAEYAAAVHERSAPLLRLVAGVAGTDPAVAELHADLERQLRESTDVYVPSFPPGAVRPDVGEQRANDLVWLYGHPETWNRLVVDRGWTRQQYVEWLIDAVRRTVLGEGG